MDVKGKIRVCQTPLANFNVELINGSPFFNRYSEFVRVLRKHCSGADPEQMLAQPVEDKHQGILNWYIPNTGEDPDSLASLHATDAEAYAHYRALREQMIEALRRLSGEEMLPQERVFIDCLLRYLDVDYSEEVTYCHDGQVTLAAWGMKMRRGCDPAHVITDDVREHRVHTIRYFIEGHGHLSGRSEIMRKHGYTLQGSRDIPDVVADAHYAFTQWKPCAPQGKRVETDMDYTAVCERKDDYEVRFQARRGGSVNGQAELIVMKKPGGALLASDIPTALPDTDWQFQEWTPSPQVGTVVDSDLTFEAVFAAKQKPRPVPPPPPPLMHKVRFVAGENGTFAPEDTYEFEVKHGETFNPRLAPEVTSKKGYKFLAWDKPITASPVTADTTYTAQYEKHLPWWRRLRWLWWLLATLLALLALLLLLKSCKSCTGFHHHEENGVVQTDSVTARDGSTIDDNGTARPIEVGDDGRLPEDDNITAPITDEDGERMPIVEQPGAPSIVGNRLFLFLENDQDNVDALARDFSKAYPDREKYSIIGYDREVKMLVVKIPANERDQIRQSINQRIPNHKFLVFDEQVYELKSLPSTSYDQPADYGWHLQAIHAQQAWSITKGSPQVKVAVVDDGIQATHPMFAGRIAEAYNVYTQDNHLSIGEGHGTHTAALASGSQANLSKGASGVAPLCKIMPIQVFDNKQCPLSALVAGIMYAVHHQADVVNVSIGPSFPGLNQLPPEQQQQLRSQFRNMETLWDRVCAIADKKRCLIVFAAGNDNILACIPPENRNLQSLAVGAVNKDLVPTQFTNYGGFCDVSAPGQNILSAFPHNALRSMDGTSMAAPIVTGTLALMKSIKKDITLTQARNVLQRTGQPVNGFLPPMILADKAIEAVRRGDFSAPRDRGMPQSGAQRIIGRVPTQPAEGGAVGATAGIVQPGGSVTSPSPSTDDYAYIRRMIRDYEQKIKELKRRLPAGR